MISIYQRSEEYRKDHPKSSGGITEGKDTSPAVKEGEGGSRALSKLGIIGKNKAFACGEEFSEMRVERSVE